MIDAGLLLPVRSLLVHIGPHKTGTTALQSAFHLARPHLERFGVRYAGSDRQPLRAVSALIGKVQRRGEPPPSMFHWSRLVTEVEDATEDRVVLSCESFADGEDGIPGIVADTFRSRELHIAVTLRPLSRILPSAWQQYVQNGLMLSYSKWLEHIFDNRDAPRSQKFWWRHDHGALIERWLTAVAPQNLIVIVADEADPDMLLRTFEQLVALPRGTLVREQSLQNRSLSYGEAELHRRLNVAFTRHGWTDIEYAKLVRHGMVTHLKKVYQPGPDEPKAATPAWAVQRAAEMGADAARHIRELGARVVGDLDSLGRLDPEELHRGSGQEPPVSLPIRAVTQAIVGVINGTRNEAPIETVIAQAEPPPSSTGWLRQRLNRWARRPTGQESH